MGEQFEGVRNERKGGVSVQGCREGGVRARRRRGEQKEGRKRATWFYLGRARSDGGRSRSPAVCSLSQRHTRHAGAHDLCAVVHLAHRSLSPSRPTSTASPSRLPTCEQNSPITPITIRNNSQLRVDSRVFVFVLSSYHQPISKLCTTFLPFSSVACPWR